jgi:hypothetical protein
MAVGSRDGKRRDGRFNEGMPQSKVGGGRLGQAYLCAAYCSCTRCVLSVELEIMPSNQDLSGAVETEARLQPAAGRSAAAKLRATYAPNLIRGKDHC